MPGGVRPRVAGVDGCRQGWVLVTVCGRRSTAEVVPSFADVLARDLDAVAVDIPIGLADREVRACDVTARAVVGPRRSSVFPAPVRAVLSAVSYQDALAVSQAQSGRGLSRQTWFLVPKIAEVDALMSPELQSRVCEAHPEACFATMAGTPLAASKRTAAGAARRLALVRRHFPDAAKYVTNPPRGARADDVLDAYATAWTAGRMLAGTAVRMGDGARDARGLAMEIVA